jgi:putative tricarboxylic transport membrane protein
VKKYPLYITFVWIAMGMFVSLYSYKLGMGQVSGPGPGFMPFWLGIIIACLASYKLITEFLIHHAKEVRAGKENISPEAGSHPGIGKLVFIVIILFAYALLLEPLGYIITTFLAMIFLLRFAGFTRWALIIVYSAIIVAVSYFMFHYLGVLFPPGILSSFGIA